MNAPHDSRGPGGHEGLTEEQVRRIGLIGALVLVAVLVLVFIIDNSKSVPVSFVFFTARISLIWVIVFSLVIGAIGGELLKRIVRKRFLHRPE